MQNLITITGTGIKRLILAATLIWGMLALGQLQAFALQQVTLAWDPSSDSTVIGYYVYYGAASGTYTNKIDSGGATSATIPNLVEGTTYYLAVTAYNSVGLESDPSNEISYTVPLAPVITLTAPAGGATYTAPATINLSANVTTNGHTISQVQFYNGSTLLNTATLPPYTFAWTSVSAGSYSLKARLVYDNGSTLDSAVASVTVTNPPPVIALSAPAGGTTYTAPATINLSANVTTNGHPITQVQFYNGSTLLNTATLPPYTFAWTSVSAGAYSLKARLVYDNGSTLDSAAASVTVTNPPPVIVLVAPTNDATFSAPTWITCTATVTTNGHTIAKVQFYNGTALLGETATAPYSLAWNCTNSGIYTIQARLVFDGGNTLDSASASIKVKPAPPVNNHVVTIVGSGKVTPDLNTKSLVVGSAYTVTAVPDADQAFAGWSGSVTSSSPTLTFVYTADFNLRATFVPGKATAPQGRFYGLFYESSRVEQTSSGAFVLSTTKRGRYSGYLQMGNTHLPFHGQLDAQGQGTNHLVRPNQSPLSLQFSLVGGAPADVVQGTVAADTWVADLLADRVVAHPKSSPATQKGAYTLVIPGPQVNDSALPFGHSFGLAKVSANGNIHLAASLADGTRFSQSAPLSARGAWGLYAPLYGGQGSMLSWLTFTNRLTDDFNGALSWIKPANRQARRYPGGFTNDCQAFGSVYMAPPVHRLLDSGLTNALLSFTGGDLTADFSNALAATASGHLSNLGTNRLSVSVSRNTGAFRGSVTDPSSGKALPFAGAWFQKTQTGYGFLLGNSQSSQVGLTQ